MQKILEHRSTFDVVNIIAGLGLAVSPWLFGFAAETAAAWNAWLIGAAVVVMSGAALLAFHKYEEWANLALGIWTIIAPWALGFTVHQAALGVHLVAGLIVAVLAAVTLWFDSNRPLSTA
ncbi:MAG: hypothetical protein CMJ42_17025 [Phyllobacteriaceae bacterium]|nr:hypothetical protein [Phyllobacteriaceae bacterium]MBA92306.1 hypothetical protein [Phyllobacteriaceae bacterium]